MERELPWAGIVGSGSVFFKENKSGQRQSKDRFLHGSRQGTDQRFQKLLASIPVSLPVQAPFETVSGDVVFVGGDRGGEFSSSNDGACSPRASPVSAATPLHIQRRKCWGDDPIEKNDTGQGLTPTEPDLVTRELFPVSRLGRSIDPREWWYNCSSSKYNKSKRGKAGGPRDCGKQVYLGGFDTAIAAARRHDRAAIKFSGVDADINFSLSDYDDMKQGLRQGGRNVSEAVTNRVEHIQWEMVPETSNEGSQHDLDLNLGMPKSPPKETANSCSLQFHRNIQNARTLKLNMENSGMKCISNPPLEGLPVTSEHPILWTAVNPKFVPNYEERASEQRTASVSPHVVANWARQMHGQFRATLNATSSNAASSGFSSVATSNSVSSVPLCYSSYPNASANASQYFSWIRPPS
ncbi:hypothetical protein DH2020_000140 [Rehmannia glutinosa]|uniref:AP2/ERF domain-containing protein n=1 Tax=Rehmannia glutinosa TaxID=99300 RepID=A0ABR0XW41_REHGL